jgi:hypothetical protein
LHDESRWNPRIEFDDDPNGKAFYAGSDRRRGQRLLTQSIAMIVRGQILGAID